ncbi:MAG TPA: sulfatase-like hydrolase/transferase [Phenylobacterium sp.]|nr:sulfatase-like hydrolase/transferase [Phenylobacterium sp.]
MSRKGWMGLGLVLLGVVSLGGLAAANLKSIILFAVANMAREEVGPTQTIEWARGPDAAPAGERPPNVIVILADDLGINDITTFGGGVAGGLVPTPNIDALAARGANMRQAYAGTAACAPSRAMIMTGRYPTRHGFEFTPTPGGMTRILDLFYNDGTRPLPLLRNKAAERELPPFSDQGLPGSEITLAEILKTRGYHNVHIGKWHLGDGPEFGARAQGFDESLLLASVLHMAEDDPGVVNAKIGFDPIDKFLWARGQHAATFNDGPMFKPPGYLSDYYTDEAVKVIEANRNRPFFLYLAHWGVHTPLQATKADYDALPQIEDHTLRVYAAMVRALDRSVGRVMEALEAQGLADNTIIVFSSDNGGPGYIGLSELNRPYRGWKLTFFEGGIRVPLMIAWPGRIAPGLTLDPPVSHLDLTPTLAAAAGASLPADRVIDGQDLLPFLTGAPPRPRPHETLFWQDGYYLAVRHGDWKLQTSTRPNKDWLYDLSVDPTEQNNLAARRPDKVAELKALLAAHRAGWKGPLYPYVGEMPVMIDKTLADPATKDDEYVYWPG